MNVNLTNSHWQLFASPPVSTDSDEPGYRLRELLQDAKYTHQDHFERRVEALPPPRDEEAAAPAPVPVPLPVVDANPHRTWPRTIAVSLVLLTVAGVGTLVTTVFNALINKSIMNSGAKTEAAA